jgi:hypothetical protein
MLFGFPLVFILGGNRLSLLNKRKPFLLKVIYTKVVMKGGDGEADYCQRNQKGYTRSSQTMDRRRSALIKRRLRGRFGRETVSAHGPFI